LFGHPTIKRLAAPMALALGVAGLTLPGPALAQTRANIQASARVLEGGAAWTAHRQALEAVRRVSSRASLTGEGWETVILTGSGVSEDALPIPRIRVVAMDPVRAGESVATLEPTGGRFSVMPGGALGEGPPAAHDSSAVAAASAGAGPPGLTERRLIVYVEHVCN
jgi:hypothetical protein